jgi:hypothetical protein
MGTERYLTDALPRCRTFKLPVDKHRARLAFFVAALVVSSAASVALPDESAVMKRLQPNQRSFVIVADRHGNPRALAYTGNFRIAVAGKFWDKRTPAIAFADIHTQPVSFVPTATYAKPNARPTPRVTKHDLTWMFEHRFVQPAPDDDRVPGTPARSEVSSPFDIDSGAFHGVRTLNGWSAERVTVSIPCAVSHFTKGPGFDSDEETGYIYIGGWGAGPNGVSVDAGLQKSSAQSGADDYAFYWKYATNKPITSDMRFPCGGPDVTLELYPVTQSLLVFTATGINADGKRVTLTMVQKTLPQDGWTPSGGSKSDGIILKRIVAIAQPYSWHHNPRHRNRFVDGSYFGVKSPTDRKPRIVFKSCEIGHIAPPAIAPRYEAWALPETWSAAVPGMYLDWPPLGVSRQTSGVCDAAGIYLHAV